MCDKIMSKASVLLRNHPSSEIISKMSILKVNKMSDQDDDQGPELKRRRLSSSGSSSGGINTLTLSDSDSNSSSSSSDKSLLSVHGHHTLPNCSRNVHESDEEEEFNCIRQRKTKLTYRNVIEDSDTSSSNDENDEGRRHFEDIEPKSKSGKSNENQKFLTENGDKDDLWLNENNNLDSHCKKLNSNKKPFGQSDKKSMKQPDNEGWSLEAKENLESDSEEVGDAMDEDEYYVEDIVDTKVRQGKRLFLVKWSGWDESYNSWEPEENMTGSQETVRRFMAEYHKKRKGKSSKPKSRSRSRNPSSSCSISTSSISSMESTNNKKKTRNPQAVDRQKSIASIDDDMKVSAVAPSKDSVIPNVNENVRPDSSLVECQSTKSNSHDFKSKFNCNTSTSTKSTDITVNPCNISPEFPDDAEPKKTSAVTSEITLISSSEFTISPDLIKPNVNSNRSESFVTKNSDKTLEGKNGLIKFQKAPKSIKSSCNEGKSSCGDGIFSTQPSVVKTKNGTIKFDKVPRVLITDLKHTKDLNLIVKLDKALSSSVEKRLLDFSADKKVIHMIRVMVGEKLHMLYLDISQRQPEEYYNVVLTEEIEDKEPVYVYGAVEAVDGTKYCLVQFLGNEFVDVIPPLNLFKRFPSMKPYFSKFLNPNAKLSSALA